MVSVLASSAVVRGFEPRPGQSEEYATGICCFSAKHTSLKREKWLARNQANVSEWGDLCLSTDCCFSDLALYKST